ncbi:potassium channel protein [Cryomorpha ignava]|uniref:Potassium channel protein n=1 Tax=Cryomorpha ignava TaxID=101383 RepID=A0A7K3WUP8_9FLAO|nr:potassium channel protein [Cryomorpha ignava]NEN25387.1 potassium channel protein [Cryomorpha ignava]
MINPFRSLRKLLLILFGIISFGTVGYMLIENYEFRDALYMTMQVVSTVGFNEVRPFTGYGKEFTIVLIVMSFSTFAFAVTSLWKILSSENIQAFLKYKSLKKKMEHLSDHVVICGYGRNGAQAAKVLRAYGQEYVVIEQNESRLNELSQQKDIIFIEGDATEDSVLEKAGILRARGLISSLEEDADNIFVVITARQLNKNLVITARANEENTVKKLMAAGANTTVTPNVLGGGYMAHNLMKPGVTEFINHLSVGGLSETIVEEVSVSLLPKNVHALTIEDLAIQKKTGCNVIGMKSLNSKMIINPAVETVLHADSILFVLGNPEQIRRLKHEFEVE